MSLKEEVELLRRIPMFAEIEPAKLKLLAFTSERIAFQPGQYLFHQGDPGEAAYIIVEGDADVMIDGAKGPCVVAHVRRNDVVGEVSILCDVPRTASIRANTRLVTLRISKQQFFRLMNEFPKIAVTVMRVIAHRLEQATLQLRRGVVERRESVQQESPQGQMGEPG